MSGRLSPPSVQAPDFAISNGLINPFGHILHRTTLNIRVPPAVRGPLLYQTHVLKQFLLVKYHFFLEATHFVAVGFSHLYLTGKKIHQKVQL